ncbi:Oidioi.mRNA.OKI2018_I69.chr2.g7375.t1.cds [Oikopleura dioica]|uniref:Oidioi.mRNA.OKI2018_I69.chr2.g7375.t1.cds n=1 Tax=Oikopleura dioica TaxID=34765 RepID=A0ABN7TCN3_OIKDI|nr:Oidioi.mRNA.OKI2018_I69.chr2.g7375.t1.cds [Oikopleura dioica]
MSAPFDKTLKISAEYKKTRNDLRKLAQELKEVRIANDPTEQKIVYLGGTVLQTFEYAKVKHLTPKALDEYNSFANRLRKLRAMRDELKMSGDPEKSELEKEELTLANKAVELELTEIYEANRRIAIDFDYNKEVLAQKVDWGSCPELDKNDVLNQFLDFADEMEKQTRKVQYELDERAIAQRVEDVKNSPAMPKLVIENKKKARFNLITGIIY